MIRVKICPSPECQTENPTDNDYCYGCGARLGAPETRPSGRSGSGSAARPTSPAVSAARPTPISRTGPKPTELPWPYWKIVAAVLGLGAVFWCVLFTVLRS